MATKLSANFTLEELIASTTAAQKKINNTPNMCEKENLQRLATLILQPIRNKYGKAITVNSGFRCAALNKAVNGSSTSQHLTGSAADISCTATSKAKLFALIKQMVESGEIKVGQLIWEYGSKTEPNWIHVSLPYSKVNQILYIYNK